MLKNDLNLKKLYNSETLANAIFPTFQYITHIGFFRYLSIVVVCTNKASLVIVIIIS